MNKLLRAGLFFPAMTIALLCSVTTLSLMATSLTHAYAATSNPSLGVAEDFAVLGNSAVANTGSTAIIGNLGATSATAITGFPPGFISGINHAGDAATQKAQHDASTAYKSTAEKPCNENLTGQDLAAKLLTPGIYCFASSAFLRGSLLLDGQGNPDSVFIIQVGSGLITTDNANVLLIRGAQPCHVFWQVAGTATLGTNTSFEGNILAWNSIRTMAGARSDGGLYALHGMVTLDNNRIQACNTSALSTAVYIVPSSVTVTKPVQHP
ncbi:ice-binding family protein [Dictyobacter arantiisoli]|uniref:Ice-binding protein n=1 Tax=Dictyobacter arantiisoli TaxID=2014874 RepID=A0A5A5T801_9CHLR|nr:ice-binding family protein [Dictyobacter arantiisoli]GCF07590.1 hypothetical protein KDI_11540 [Dictyobacter arantiisoli]